MGINITTFLWDKLPDYFHELDSNKDGNGKGTLERYLSIFGVELQQEVVPKLENLINELDPETATDLFLSEIAYQVARPKDVLGDLGIYRTVLKQIISIYQIKGTAKSFTLFFNLLGMKASIIEYFPPENLYDSDLIYDDNTLDAQLYDNTECDIGCVEYSIQYENLPGKSVAPLNPVLRNNIMIIVQEFLQPIDCKLRSLIYSDGDGYVDEFYWQEGYA